MLEGVCGRINEVFILTENTEVALRILVEAYAVLEIDCVLSFSTFASCFALFFSCDTLTDILIDQLGELGVVSADLALVHCTRQDLTLLLIRCLEMRLEELLLYGSLEIAHGCRYLLYLAHSTHIAYLHYVFSILLYNYKCSLK